MGSLQHSSLPLPTLQLKVEGTTAYVEVLLKLAGGKSVDLTEEVYSADVSVFQSMDFGSSTTRSDVPSGHPLPPPLLPVPTADDSKLPRKVSLDTIPSPLTLLTSDNVSL